MPSIPLKQLEFDKELYPRMQPDWMTVHQYAEALKAGARFPPILVAAIGGKLVVVDGIHRRDAHKAAKRKSINCIIVRGWSKAKIFAEAVRLNCTHGRKLSIQERTAAAHRLMKEFNFGKNDIQTLLQTPWKSLETLMQQRMGGEVTFTGISSLYATKKAPLAGMEMNPNEVAGAQKTLAAQDQMQIFKQALEILSKGHLDTSDAKLVEVVVQVGACIRALGLRGKKKKKAA